jgi:hypothetical protein
MWASSNTRLTKAARKAADTGDGALLDAVLAEIDHCMAGNVPRWYRTRLQELHRQIVQIKADLNARSAVGDPLRTRLRLLLLLLMYRRNEVCEGREALSAFATKNSDEEIRIDLAQPFSSRTGRQLQDGCGRGFAAFGETNMTWLRDVRRQIEQALRSSAASLVIAGAEVRGLQTDTVPLIAFALLHGEIPIGNDAAASPLAKEQANNAVIAVAEEIAEMPAASRAAFTDLYRLSFLLGVAQCYAEQTGLTSLS